MSAKPIPINAPQATATQRDAPGFTSQSLVIPSSDATYVYVNAYGRVTIGQEQDDFVDGRTVRVAVEIPMQSLPALILRLQQIARGE